MNEDATTSGSAELSKRLSQAKALLEAGKQKQALNELRHAEVLARGNADDLLPAGVDRLGRLFLSSL